MSCRWCEARLAPLVDGDLRPVERGAVLQHVARCATCAKLLDELRCIDALLLRPSEVRLGPNFTTATMAELRDLPRPARCRAPIAALVVCYLVACWLLLAAALALAPFVLASIAAAAAAAGRTTIDALGGIGHLIARLAGWTLASDAVLALALVALVRRAQPSIIKRLRS